MQYVGYEKLWGTAWWRIFPFPLGLIWRGEFRSRLPGPGNDDMMSVDYYFSSSLWAQQVFTNFVSESYSLGGIGRMVAL